MKKLIGSLIVMTLLSVGFMTGCGDNKAPTSPASTATPTITVTPTKTSTGTSSPTKTPTNSPTNSPTNTPTQTPTNSPTPTPTETPSGLTGPAPVTLGRAAPYAVLSYNSITNVPNTTICGSMGEYPGSSVTGAPTVTCVGSTTDIGVPAASDAQTDLTTAYGDATGRTGAAVNAELGGQTLVPGVYTAASFDIASGTTLYLDGTGYTGGGVFIFQTAGVLTTADSTSVVLMGPASAANVYWQIGGAYASLGASSIFKGTIMCPGYVSLGHLAVVTGRIMSQVSYVAMDNNTITLP